MGLGKLKAQLPLKTTKIKYQMELFEKINTATKYIQSRTANFQPQAGIVLGTGLGQLAKSIEVTTLIPYGDIPFFPKSTVKSHDGELLLGYLEGKAVVAMSGRFHYYEGYSMEQVTFPIRVMSALGINQVYISNAAGSVNAKMEAGDLVFIKDHINLQPENPLRGKNDERLGPRFPDLLHTYNPITIEKAIIFCKNTNIRAHSGVYVGLQGPNLETPAEYRYLNIIGGDVVGMSTVPEVLVAKHSGLEIFVLSVVSNRSFPIEDIQETTLESVIKTVEEASPKAEAVIRYLLQQS